ncbi:RsmB/NOP family class I SAM-dependent RNA methyltransferase [Propylenella binzhouense]|uniref:RsmB/NOP family class I SAM-dependent RNA methyltransferase n=1 Tax=Propylenella binzhouense TaxID=2555902 RepID=UPI0031B5F538
MSRSPRRREAAQPRPANAGGVPGLPVRLTAVSILEKVLGRGVALDALVDDRSGLPGFRDLPPRDRALVRQIVATALRRRGEIDAAVARCLDRPLDRGAVRLYAILAVGAAQILFLEVADHAAVSLAVTQAGNDRQTRAAKGLVNSVLRRIARERGELAHRPDAARLDTPDWLFERWSASYGEAAAEAIAAAHLVRAPLDLTPRIDPEAVAAATGGTILPTGSVRVETMPRVSTLPGYDAGAWWVQDAAAALPARLLPDLAGRRVADLCAAPGGKTAQLAAAGALVTAVDLSPGRLRRLAGNLARLRLDAELVAADLLAWEPERTFDAVLLDAPCSATGTIRRHPDIPWLKSPADMVSLADLQARMLARAARFVAPGGRLVYCTCSLEPEEGERQADRFLEANPGFRLEPATADEVGGMAHFLSPAGTLRTLPSMNFGESSPAGGLDGFFAARFVNTADSDMLGTG